MRYEITKCRPDGFYRYIKYDDNDSSVLKTYYDEYGELVKIKFNVGWSLYSKQKTEEEKKAWLEAVRKYHEEHQIVGLAATLHSYIQDVRDFISLDDANFPPNKDPIMPSLASLISLVEPNGKCDDEFLTKIHQMGLGPLPTMREMFRYAYKAERFNIENEINKQLYSYAQLGITTFVTPVLDMADEMVDTVFGTIDLVYTEVVRLCSAAYRLYKRAANLKKDPEERKRLLRMFLNELKKFGKDIYEYLYQALCIEVYIEIFKTMRNMWMSRKEIWKSLIAKLKSLVDFDYKSLGSEVINNLAGVIIGFLPLLGALVGAIFAKKCTDEEEVKAARRGTAYNLSDGKTTDPEKIPKILEEKRKTADNKLRKSSVVYCLCSDEKNNFSFNKKYKTETIDYSDSKDSSVNNSNNENTEDSSTNNVIELHCKVSMCDYEPPTDLDYFMNDVSLFPELVTIEFDKSFNYSFNVSVGQIVRIDDVIGYISDIPVKSQFDFKINEINDNYIVGEYYFNDLDPYDEDITQKVVTYANNRINAQDTSDYEKLQSNFTDIAACEDFILNYGPYCRIPDFALNTGNRLTGKSIGKYIDDYYEFADNERTKQADEMQRVAGRQNAYNRGMAGQMYTLKEEIDNVKNKMVNRFISLSTSPKGGTSMKCKSRIADYSLYTYYLDYLYSDRFNYSDDNKFVVKLHNLISEFIAERTRIELSSENIDALITDFNETCDKYIRSYWKFNNQSYYQVFANLFTSDYYELDTEKIVPKNNDKNAFTLYNRIYMYLTSLTSFTPKESQNKIIVNEDTDVNALLNNLSNMSNDSAINKNDEIIKANLRKIALKFITIRKIEQNMQNGFVDSFIKENKITIEQIRQGGNNPVSVNEYYDGEILMMGLMTINRSAYLGPYLSMLKKITEAESKKLHSLINEAVTWYSTHRNDNANIMNLFKPLMQINWPISSLIYKNNTETDFYLFSPVMSVTPPPTTIEELKRLETKNQQDFGKIKEPESIGAYPKTADGCGVGDIQYWLRYCGIATAIHCMMPVYWSTGLVIDMVPIMLPVIYIPFYVLRGRVTIVFGLGICGIAIAPMILFVNMGTLAASIIIPINMVVDMLLNMTKKISDIKSLAVNAMLLPMIKTLDAQIHEMEVEKEDIPYQIQEIKSLQIKNKAKVLSSINIVQGNDLTFKAENNASQENLVEAAVPKGNINYESYVLDEEDLIKKLSEISWPTYEQREDSFTKDYREQLAAAEAKEKESNNYNTSNNYSTAEWTQIDVNTANTTGTWTSSNTYSDESASSTPPPASAFKNINGESFVKYSAGDYLNTANSIKSAIAYRTIHIKNIPQDFLNVIRKVSQSTGVPMIHYIMVAASESGFKNVKSNGYNGYFGQGKSPDSLGYGYTLEQQARSAVTTNYQKVKKCSPGAKTEDLLALAYIAHQLPVVGYYIWNYTKGKIYTLNPNYIAENIKVLYEQARQRNKKIEKLTKVRLAEAIICNVCSQWYARQALDNPELRQYF